MKFGPTEGWLDRLVGAPAGTPLGAFPLQEAYREYFALCADVWLRPSDVTEGQWRSALEEAGMWAAKWGSVLSQPQVWEECCVGRAIAQILRDREEARP